MIARVLLALSCAALLVACGGPVQSPLMQDLNDENNFLDTHVISKSMLDAAMSLVEGEIAEMPADQQVQGIELGDLTALIEGMDKVMVFNKDDLNRTQEDSLSNRIRTRLQAEGSELLLETTISGGEFGLYAVESAGVASRVHVFLRSPYAENGSRSWPSIEVEEGGEVDQALAAQQAQVDEDLAGLTDLVSIDSGLTLIECNGTFDLSQLSSVFMSVARQLN